MSLKDLVASRLSAPAGRVLDAPIRDIVHEILKEAGYASPAEIQAIRDELRDLQRQMSAIQGRSDALARQLAEARAGDDPRVQGLSDRLDALAAEIDRRVGAVEARIGEIGGRLALSAPEEGAAPRLDRLEAQIAAFPSMVEQRLAPIEARLALLPAEIETKIEDFCQSMAACCTEEGCGDEGAPDGVSPLPAADPAEVVEPTPAAVEADPRSIEVVRAVGDTITLIVGNLLDAIDTAAGGRPEVEPAPAAPAPVEPAEAPKPAVAAPADCRVPGCGKPIRARGFCGSHYQQWRRGLLPGYVSIDGLVQIGAESRNVGQDRAGLAYEVRDGQVWVEGVIV